MVERYRTRTLRCIARVYYNAGANGEATKVRFSSNQYWVGNDLVEYANYTMKPLDRALRVMRYYENRKQTDRKVYRLAQWLATSLLIDKPLTIPEELLS